MWIQNGRGERVGSCPSTLFLVYGGIPGDDFAYHLVFVLFGSQLCPCLFPTTKHLQICPLHVSRLGHSTVCKKRYCSDHPRALETSMRLSWACLSWLIAQIRLPFSCFIGLGTSGVSTPHENEAHVLFAPGYPILSGDSIIQHQQIPFFSWLYSDERSQ